MKSKSRRSGLVDGHVNFPVSDPNYKDTGEGGMAVYLLFEEDPNICIPGVGCFVYADCGLANLGEGTKMAISSTVDAEADLKNGRVYWIGGQHASGLLYLGSTGAVLAKTEGGYWTATYDDLTDQGKELYNLLHMLYAGSPPKIVTFLDT